METMLVCLVLFGKVFIKVGALLISAIVIEDVIRKVIRKRRTSKGKGV